MKYLLLAGFGGALIVGVACGGNVVVDGAGGTGGAGPTTNNSTSSSSSSSSVTTSSSMSTSSGPVCSCAEFCAVLQGCGLSGVECPSYCADIDPQTILCACSSAPAGCDAVTQCFGSSTVVTTAGVGGGGGGSGTPTLECFECIDNAPCALEFGACNNNPDCEAIVDCHDMLDWTFEAVGQCDPFYPNGYDDYYAVMSCAVCKSCFEPCAQSSLATYCFDG